LNVLSDVVSQRYTGCHAWDVREDLARSAAFSVRLTVKHPRIAINTPGRVSGLLRNPIRFLGPSCFPIPKFEVGRPLPGDIRTRNATNIDIENLTRVYAKSYGSIEQAEKHVRDFVEYHGVKLALANNRIVGVLFWMQREGANQGQAEIVDLWVEESERRRGIGERLLMESIREIEDHYSSQGHALKNVLLFTTESNSPARTLYEKMGFEVVADLGDLCGLGGRDILYVYRLG
jgi:ribosomal protein S18 acetylase RimI-like enzyme